jgi:two-component system nitrate/nitrite response regulator NarL
MPEPAPAREPARPRTIVVDADPLARRATTAVLRTAGFIVIAEAGTAHEGVELAAHYRPDLVVTEARLPGLDGTAATRLVCEKVPETKVVLFTTALAHEDAVEALRAGAVGCLTKDVDEAALPRALHGALKGEAVISRSLAMHLVMRLRRTREDGVGMRPVHSALSCREWEVLDLLCEGLSTDELADRFVLSTETIRSHVKSILRKLQVSSRAEAVLAAKALRADVAAPERVPSAVRP